MHVKNVKFLHLLFLLITLLLGVCGFVLVKGSQIVSEDAHSSSDTDGVLVQLHQATKTCKDADAYGRLAIIGDVKEGIAEKRSVCFAEVAKLVNRETITNALSVRFAAQDASIRNVRRESGLLIFDATVSETSTKALAAADAEFTRARDNQLDALQARTQANVRKREILISIFWTVLVGIFGVTLVSWKVVINAMNQRKLGGKVLRDASLHLTDSSMSAKLDALAEEIESGLKVA